MSHRKALLLAALGAAWSLAPSSGRAAMATVAFEGVVTHAADSFSLLPPVAVGDTFTGTYSFDDATPAVPCDPDFPVERCALYVFAVEAGLRLQIGGASLDFLNSQGPLIPLHLTINNDPGPRAFDHYSLRYWPASEGSLSLSVAERSRLAPQGFLDSTELLLPQLTAEVGGSLGYHLRREVTPARFEFDPETGEGRFIPSTVRDSSFEGVLTSLELVPEPDPVLLLATAFLLGLVAYPRAEIAAAQQRSTEPRPR